MNTMSKDGGSVTSTIVERVFQTTVPDALALPDFVPLLTARPGIVIVVPDPDRGMVRVTYDVRHVDFAAVQRLLDRAGAVTPRGLWQRLRTEWLVSLDNNCRDNALRRPTCCSRPPASAGRQKHEGNT